MRDDGQKIAYSEEEEDSNCRSWRNLRYKESLSIFIRNHFYRGHCTPVNSLHTVRAHVCTYAVTTINGIIDIAL